MKILTSDKHTWLSYVFISAFCIIAALSAAGCGDISKNAASGEKDSAGNAEKVRLGADSSPFSFQFRVAQAKGFFSKHNIDAEIQTFSYGIDTLNALVLGQVDSGEGMDYAVATRLGGKDNLKVVSYITTPSLDGADLYVTDNTINTPGDLSGKTVAAQKGTVNEYVWAQTFKRFGVDPKSVNILYFSSNAEMLSALETGKAVAMWGDKSLKSKISGISGIRSLGDYSLINFEMKGYLLFKQDFIDQHPQTVENVLLALKDAADYINAHPEETAQIAYDDLKLPKEDVLKTLETYKYDIRFNKDDYEHLNDIAAWSMQNGLIKNSYSVKDFLSVEPLKQAFPGLSDVYDGK